MRFPRISLALSTLVLGLAGMSHPAFAQEDPPQWMPLDSMPPGTPPTMQMLADSDLQHTRLNVTIHGFWRQRVVQPGVVFERISLDLTHDGVQYGAIGRPELPALHHILAALVGNTVGNPQIEPLEEIPFEQMLIYPRQPSVIEHLGDPPLPFEWDQAFYSQRVALYPAGRGAAIGPRGSCVGVRLVEAETYPFRYSPANRLLFVTRSMNVTIPHPGTDPIQPIERTHRQSKLLEDLVDNGDLFEGVIAPKLWLDGDYLIISDATYVEAIRPLANQKFRRGFSVYIARTSETGTTSAAIRSYISSWYALGPTGKDRYVLLVGDVNKIPMSVDKYGNPSDDPYACFIGTGGDGLDDPYPEVYLGRLCPDSPASCADMVAKILRYEDSAAGDWLGNVALVAHKEGYPGKYTGAQEAIANVLHAVQPIFTKLYGGTGVMNSQVKSAIDAGAGVVCYRGHGDATSWAQWNLASQSYGIPDVQVLANGSLTPAVFSIACDTSDLFYNDCLGEIWMETTGRAVSYYGSTRPSYTEPNHTLDIGLFKAIYDDNETLIAHAIASAEAVMIAKDGSDGEYNAWMYLLLGDPEMKIYRQNPSYIAVDYPDQIGLGGQDIAVSVRDATGAPVEWAVVSLYKDGEVLANRYTDSQGDCMIPVDPASPGVLEVMAYTEFDGRGPARGQIDVVQPAGIVAGPGASTSAPSCSAIEPNPSRGPTAISFSIPQDGPVRVEILDAAGRHVATLVDACERTGTHRIQWNGMSQGGEPVAGGLYFALVAFRGAQSTTKFSIVK